MQSDEDLINLINREWTLKEIEIENKYFLKYPQSKIKTIKDKIIDNQRLERIKLKELNKINKKYERFKPLSFN